MTGGADVTDTITLVVPYNSKRKKVTIINNDALLTVWLGHGSVSTTTGIPLYPKGSMSDYRDPQGFIYQGGWTAIASAAGPARVTFIEEE